MRGIRQIEKLLLAGEHAVNPPDIFFGEDLILAGMNNHYRYLDLLYFASKRRCWEEGQGAQADRRNKHGVLLEGPGYISI